MTDGLRAGWFPISTSNRVILRLPANSNRPHLKGRIRPYVFLMLGEGGGKEEGEHDLEEPKSAMALFLSVRKALMREMLP